MSAHSKPAQSALVIVSGAGAAGAAFALALAKAGIAANEIVLADPDLASDGQNAQNVKADARILALNAGVCHFLDHLGVWEALAPQSYPMRAMALSDTALEEDIRPTLLALEATEGDEALSHMVPLPAMIAALRAACRKAGIRIVPAPVSRFEAGMESIAVTIGDEVLQARLLVAADGAKSPIRMRAGITFHGWAYGQTAIVASLRHNLPHHGEAIQHFLPAGTFALLPLDEGRSSMVWSEKAEIATRLLAGDRRDLMREIERRAAGRRGDILGVDAVSAHPLSLGLSRRFIGSRLALIADAAHVVHPLAGQGLNLGLEDAAMLAELVVDQLQLGLDPGAPDCLETYQARRRPAAVAMAAATDGINRLFSSDFAHLRLVRDLGLGIVNRLPALKRQLVLGASGLGRQAPRVFREGQVV